MWYISLNISNIPLVTKTQTWKLYMKECSKYVCLEILTTNFFLDRNLKQKLKFRFWGEIGFSIFIFVSQNFLYFFQILRFWFFSKKSRIFHIFIFSDFPQNFQDFKDFHIFCKYIYFCFDFFISDFLLLKFSDFFQKFEIFHIFQSFRNFRFCRQINLKIEGICTKDLLTVT